MLKSGMVRALGTMSGTSLDGVDAAVVETDGDRIEGFGETAYRPYSDGERAAIRSALGRWPGEEPVAVAAEIVERAHAGVMGRFRDVDLAGFHGQTLAHDPGGKGTHQAGDGQALAEALGLPVVWDFRSEDVARGGQGAPLAPVWHFALARWIGAKAPVAFLNLGGVGNLTWVDPRLDRPERPGALLAFDTGPANAPLNDLLHKRRGESFDRDGALAARGRVDRDILGRFSRHAWFGRVPPKSLDRDAFGFLDTEVAALSDADAAATLTAATAVAVARGSEHFPQPVATILVTGGGRHNPVMMELLRKGMKCAVVPVESVGLDGDMLEAQAFAYLAVRVQRGLPTSFPATTGVPGPVSGGRVSAPRGGVSAA
ncbi:anhydro-N-acetylmuramic acid kinase [Tropicimonas sp.]|uniref:anhydro-N-acetylmuramic acid kinase n=1 Tax=Tropicimonas sp. TaxID=2067044 RepID=UPI003A835BBC